ncbi:MAG: hypothetical protein COB49_07520 [Alphaproteobacteria bacterium]|nr:MAG: hypothetical protein COB49_07520 [Alphaproteobacteria bacterium]
MPKRIQRKRTKGWRMPENTVYVGRPTKWGNPYKVTAGKSCSCRSAGECDHMGLSYQDAVDLFKDRMERLKTLGRLDFDTDDLEGKDLACWCPLDQPCHADILLKLVNPPQGKAEG